MSQIIHTFYINYCGYEECKSRYFTINELDAKVVLSYPSFKLSFLIPFPTEAESISEFGVALNPNFSYQVWASLSLKPIKLNIFSWHLRTRKGKFIYIKDTASVYLCVIVFDTFTSIPIFVLWFWQIHSENYSWAKDY